MVKFMRHAPFLELLKPIYDKPLGYKIKVLWKAFQKTNPTLAIFGPIAMSTGTVLYAYSTYLAIHENPVKKYYDYICIFRPEDPRVKTIRTDDSIGVTSLKLRDTMLPQDY